MNSEKVTQRASGELNYTFEMSVEAADIKRQIVSDYFPDKNANLPFYKKIA